MIAPVLVMLWCAAAAVAVLSLGCVLLVGYFIVVGFSVGLHRGRVQEAEAWTSNLDETSTHIMGGDRG